MRRLLSVNIFKRLFLLSSEADSFHIPHVASIRTNTCVFCSNQIRTRVSLVAMATNLPDKKETQHTELINTQKDQKRWTSFVYISSKVCQLVLLYTSFPTRGQNVLKKNGHSKGQTVKSHKMSVFIMLSCWTSSSNADHLSRPNGTRTLILCELYLQFHHILNAW